MSDKVFLAYNDNAMEPACEGVNELYREDVVATWQALVNDSECELDNLESKWGFPMIVGDEEMAQNWLNQLESSGKVSDTEENMCWAIAGTREEAEALLKEEIAKFE